MIKKYFFVFFSFTMLLNLNASSQNKAKQNTGLFNEFHSINSFGILYGASDISYLVHSINGFKVNKFFVGAGLGYDRYRFKSAPVFLDVRYDLVGKKNVLQLVADAGANLSFSSQEQDEGITGIKYKPGSFIEAGLGYHSSLNKHEIVFEGAFTYKQTIRISQKNVWNPALNRTESSPVKDNYQFNRILIKAGWEF